MEWESSVFDSDIELYGSDVGTVKTQKEFSANVSNKTGSLYMISVLTFPSNSSRNGVAIVCRDLLDGAIGACIINATYPREYIHIAKVVMMTSFSYRTHSSFKC